MKTILAFVAGLLTATAWGGLPHSSDAREPRASAAPLALQERRLGGMLLLPGYLDHPRGGLDTVTGFIAKESGPRIDYDIGVNAGGWARTYAERNASRSWSLTLPSSSGTWAVITYDESAEYMVVTVDSFADFSAKPVRSKRDVAEVLAMVLTFDFTRFIGLKK